MSEQEKKDKRFSLIVSAIIHSSLIALFLVLVAWKAPDPPLPEYGIELNLGFQEAGSGDTERLVDAPLEDTENETPPDAETETENNELEETQEEEVVEEQPVEEAKVETPPVEVAKEEAPPVQETVKETVTTPEKTEVKVVEKTPPVTEIKKEEVTPPKEEKKEEVKPKEEPKPVVDNRALMGVKKSNTDSKDATSNSQGTQTDTRGNMGNPTGKTNTTGTDPGGEDLGVSLSLQGWKWDSPPSKKDNSELSGEIIFSFDVDERGRVSNVIMIQGGTIKDNLVVDFYKRQVQELTFIQEDQSALPKIKSSGKITFVIKTN